MQNELFKQGLEINLIYFTLKGVLLKLSTDLWVEHKAYCQTLWEGHDGMADMGLSKVGGGLNIRHRSKSWWTFDTGCLDCVGGHWQAEPELWIKLPLKMSLPPSRLRPGFLWSSSLPGISTAPKVERKVSMSLCCFNWWFFHETWAHYNMCFSDLLCDLAVLRHLIS